MMLSITKLQNLKVIHNTFWGFVFRLFVVINHKTTKIESNSQRAAVNCVAAIRCYQSQNYKIWKQFTTGSTSINLLSGLLSIIKLQNLKAIHNLWIEFRLLLLVVINHKTTKFESDSQPAGATVGAMGCCYQSQNYKIWKQFTTL